MNVRSYIGNVHQEKGRSKDWALRDSRCYVTRSRIVTLYHHLLCPILINKLQFVKESYQERLMSFWSYICNFIKGLWEVKSTCSLLFIAVALSLIVTSSCDSHEWCSLKPNWLSAMMLDHSKYFINWLTMMCSIVLQITEVNDMGR